jgi:hypothetical protein
MARNIHTRIDEALKRKRDMEARSETAEAITQVAERLVDAGFDSAIKELELKTATVAAVDNSVHDELIYHVDVSPSENYSIVELTSRNKVVSFRPVADPPSKEKGATHADRQAYQDYNFVRLVDVLYELAECKEVKEAFASRGLLITRERKMENV